MLHNQTLGRSMPLGYSTVHKVPRWRGCINHYGVLYVPVSSEAAQKESPAEMFAPVAGLEGKHGA